MQVVIIKYNAGNTKSVEHALHRIGIQPVISDDAEIIRSADKVIFPGVGHAESTMKHLRALQLDILIKQLKQPVLGICLGQQLMCAHSEEGDVDCLDIFPVKVKKFQSEPLFKIPHMGWNTIQELKSPLFSGLDEKSYVYFVHSYYCEKSDLSIATCDYILPFAAALQKDNFYAVQFHPEKSAEAGGKILKNFISI
ncbi:MAG: imidazole glycerol phosphate synthase subunit HisH [Chitinophagales bacterium]